MAKRESRLVRRSELGAFQETLTADETVSVGTGGDYSTITEALNYLSQLKPAYERGGFTAIILLKTGFVMAEEIHIFGQNFGWVTILAEDATVTITRSALTTNIGTTYNGATFSTKPSAQLPQNTYAPFFGFNGAVLPAIGCTFSMDSSGSATINVYGILLHSWSFCKIHFGCGVKNVVSLNASYEGRGCSVNHNSGLSGWGADFSGCDIGARISNASWANLRSSTISACRIAIDANGSSIVTAQNSDFSACTQHAIYALGGATVKASACDMTGCAPLGTPSIGYSTVRLEGLCVIDVSYSDISNGQRGIYATEGALVSFDHGISDGMAGFSLYITSGSEISATSASITNSLDEGGVFCNKGSKMYLADSTITGHNNATNGVYVAGGFADVTGATVTGNGGGGGKRDLAVAYGGVIQAYQCTTTSGVGTPALSDTNVTYFGVVEEDGVIYTENNTPVATYNQSLDNATVMSFLLMGA